MLSSRFPLCLLAVFAFAAAAPAFAVNNSATLALAFDPPHGAPAVSIVQPADYLCAIVSIRSTAKDTERQAVAVQESLRRITTAVQRSNTFQLISIFRDVYRQFMLFVVSFLIFIR